MRYIGIFNTGGGTFRTMDVAGFAEDARRIFEEHGQTLECRLIADGELMAALRDAAADEDCEALLVGGGDGTISAAAAICYRTGKPLAVVPAGTMNLFARSLGLPLDLHAALRAVAGGAVRAVDIATANGRPFVHQFSVGVHPRLVRIRDSLRYKGRLGKLAASVRAVVAAIWRPPRFQVEVRTGQRLDLRPASSLSVSNNILGAGHVPHADRLDGGVLGVYVVAPMSAGALARFCLTVMLGTWKANPLVSEKQVDRVVLSFRRRRKKKNHAVIDGELIALEPRVEIEIHAGALAVVAPLRATAEAAA